MQLITHPETGETLSIKDWAERLGLSYNRLSERIKKESLEEALTPKRINPGITNPETGETLTRKEWTQKLGISDRTLYMRLKKYPLDKVFFQKKESALIIHPQTNESFTQKEWANRLGLKYCTLRSRLMTMTLEDALTPNISWSLEEDIFLCDVYRSPNLEFLWNQHAAKNGWRRRTRQAIQARICVLIEQKEITSRREIEEADGWLTERQLSEKLAVSNKVIDRWINNCGLKAYRNGGNIKIHLQHFTTWATRPDGAKEIAKGVNSNPLAVNWVLTQIGNWIGENSPRVGHGNNCIN